MTECHSRVRNDFTATEERDLVEFLADYEPAARMGIFPYRELANVRCVLRLDSQKSLPLIESNSHHILESLWRETLRRVLAVEI